jgi:hypothetical protein
LVIITGLVTVVEAKKNPLPASIQISYAVISDPPVLVIKSKEISMPSSVVPFPLLTALVGVCGGI